MCAITNLPQQQAMCDVWAATTAAQSCMLMLEQVVVK